MGDERNDDHLWENLRRLADQLEQMRGDVKQLRIDMQRQHTELGNKLDLKFTAMDARNATQDSRLTALETTNIMTRWVAGILVAVAGVVIAGMALFL